MVRVLEYATLQEAWEGINTYMALNEEEVLKNNGGGIYGTEFIAYNTMISVNKAWVDPNFDFGSVLGYNIKKWTTLVKNYVDFNYLDLLKSEISSRVGKNAKSYNYAYHFSNKYGGGKDCLLTLIFQKKPTDDYPTMFFSVRTSEITSRLIFDFLLIQRIAEYVYGKDYPVAVQFFAPTLFVTAERFSMFATFKGWKYFKKRLSRDLRFQRRIIDVYEHFISTDTDDIKYKAHQRCAQAIQKDEDGNSVRYVVPMIAKNLKLHKLLKVLPKDVVTQREINKYIKENAG